MDSQQFEELIGVLRSIAGELETIAGYIADAPNAESTTESFRSLKRIAEALEYGKY